MQNSYKLKNDELVAQAKDIECLILGSSHGYFDIKPKEFKIKTFNLANTSQSLAQDFSLLAHFIDKLPKLKVVIIPISYFTMEYSALDSPEDWRDCYTFRFLGATEASWWQMIAKPQYFSLLCLYGPSKTREILKSSFALSYAKDTDMSGWYFGNYGSAINPQSASNRVQLLEQSMKSEHIEKNKQQLQEILSLCLAHRVKVLLVSTPVHEYYFQRLNKVRWLKAQELVAEIAKKYHALYIDYSQDERFKKSDFRDNDHLNQHGAEIFSRILNR